MTYSSEKVYVSMEREIIRESFSFYASRSTSNSMIGNRGNNGIIDLDNSIDAVVSYAPAPAAYLGSVDAPRITSRCAYGNCTSASALPSTNSRPSLLEYKAHAENKKRGGSHMQDPDACSYTYFNYFECLYLLISG